MKNVKLSPLEQKVYDIILRYNQVYVSEIADKVFKNIPLSIAPKSPNNSVVSAIRQMNKKSKSWKISGQNRGSQGKLVWLTKG